MAAPQRSCAAGARRSGGVSFCPGRPRVGGSDATVPILEVATGGDPVSLRERRPITQPKVIEAIFTCLGYTVRAPPIAPSLLAHFDF